MQLTFAHRRRFLLLATCSGLLAALLQTQAMAEEQKPDKLIAKQILDRMAKAYANCESYRDSGVAPPLWLVSRRSPKGTVLVIAVVIYYLSWQIDDTRVREMHLLTGTMRMLGFAGGILGLVDLFRRRKPKDAIEPTDEPERTHG